MFYQVTVQIVFTVDAPDAKQAEEDVVGTVKDLEQEFLSLGNICPNQPKVIKVEEGGAPGESK